MKSLESAISRTVLNLDFMNRERTLQTLHLGVNLDHIATIRQARRIAHPNLIEAARLTKQAGAHQITIHLREDRRHIQDYDVINILRHTSLPINVECATEDGIIDFLCDLKPQKCTLVPEKREELTTEGGLDMSHPKLHAVVQKLKKSNIWVSAFIDPDVHSAQLAKNLGCDSVELHTGEFANYYMMNFDRLARTHASKVLSSPNIPKEIYAISSNKWKELLKAEKTTSLNLLSKEFERICHTAFYAKETLGLEVYAGHGLNNKNLIPIANIPPITELNIGHSIIARSCFIGLKRAIKEVLKAMQSRQPLHQTLHGSLEFFEQWKRLQKA